MSGLPQEPSLERIAHLCVLQVIAALRSTASQHYSREQEVALQAMLHSLLDEAAQKEDADQAAAMQQVRAQPDAQLYSLPSTCSPTVLPNSALMPPAMFAHSMQYNFSCT